MKRLLLIGFLSIMGHLGFPQGLNFEFGLNPSYDQLPSAVVSTTQSTWLVFESIALSGWGGNPQLLKVDTLGVVEWNVSVVPDLGGYYPETTWVNYMIPTPDNGVIIAGKMMLGCDFGPLAGFVHKYDSQGQLEWDQVFDDQQQSGSTDLTGLYIDDQGNTTFNLAFSQSWPYDSTHSELLTVSSSGVLQDTLVVNPFGLQGFEKLGAFQLIAFKDDSLFGFGASGITIGSWAASSNIQNVITVNTDTLVVLTADSIFLFDDSLTMLNSNAFGGYSMYSNLKLRSNGVRFISSDVVQQHVLSVNFELQLQDVNSIPVTLDIDDRKDFSDTHFSAAQRFSLISFHSVRLMDFSMIDQNDNYENELDVGVSSIQVYQTDPHLHPPTNNIYSFNYDVGVMIQNNSPDTIRSVRLNCRRGWTAACNATVFSQNYSGLAIPPGDSLLIDVGWIGMSTGVPYDPNVGNQFCVYSSHPNGQTDLNITNDSHCELGYSGPVGLEDLQAVKVQAFPNPTKGQFKVSFPSGVPRFGGNGGIEVFDIHGRSVLSQSPPLGDLGGFDIDLTDQPTGLYILKITDGERVINSKIIKE